MDGSMENCSRLECFYAILGVHKESSTADIKAAYRKLAMRWHPDKCSNARGDAREQAKLKFQAVQEAYSVLSDDNRRVLYDAGFHEEVEDPDLQDFMGELVNLMERGSSAPSKRNADDEFEELKKLYMNIVDMSLSDCQRACQQFGVKQSNSGDPNRCEEAKRECAQFLASATCLDPNRKMSNCEAPFNDTLCPRPHANLYTAGDFSHFDFCSEFFDEASGNFANDCFSDDEEVCDVTDSEQHGKMFSHDFHSFDFNLLNVDLASGRCDGVPQRTVEFDATRAPASDLKDCPTAEFVQHSSARPGASPSLEGFCIGRSGDEAEKDCRGQGKSAKVQRKKRKEKAMEPPSTWCDVCCQEKLGAGLFCFCTLSGVGNGSAPSFFVS